MKKIILIVIIVIVVALLGCITQQSEKIAPLKVNWCEKGTNISSVGPLGNITTFVVKGITEHNGMQLCEADYDNNGTMIQYYSQDKKYNIMAIKTKNGTQEINVNRVIN